MVLNSGETDSIEIFGIAEGKSCSFLRVVTLLFIDVSDVLVLVSNLTGKHTDRKVVFLAGNKAFECIAFLSLSTGIGWPALTSCSPFPTSSTTSTQCSCATGTRCRSKGTRRPRQHPSTWAQLWPATCVASSSWCCTTLSWSPSASLSLW